MKFDKKQGESAYVLLYPKFEENKVLKNAAEAAGFSSALAYDKDEKAFRLYKDLIPAGIDAKKFVGGFATAAAKKASKAESAEFAKNKDNVAKSIGAKIDESKLYYPAVTGGGRKEFDEMRKNSETQFYYNRTSGAFVHKSGPTEGFEKFQTQESKDLYHADYEKIKNKTNERLNEASESVEVLNARAAGRAFLADNSKGFLMPSTNEVEIRATQTAAMKSASNEEISQVFNITNSDKVRLEKKLYAIQINAALKSNPSLTTENFNKMDYIARRAASNNVNLPKEDFSRLVALRGGFLSLREEMKERGIVESLESARDKSQSKDASTSNEKTAETKAPTKAKAAASKETVAKEAGAEAKEPEAKKPAKASRSAIANQLLNASQGIGG